MFRRSADSIVRSKTGRGSICLVESLEDRKLFCSLLHVDPTMGPIASQSVSEAWQSLAGDDLSATQTMTASATAVQAWQSRDIGNVGVQGSSALSGGVHTVRGSGADIFGTADAFRYVYQKLEGNGQIVVRTDSFTNTHDWAKSGVMIRNSLAFDSAHASMFMTPAQGSSFQFRSGNGNVTQFTQPAGASSFPLWLKLVRSGSTVTGFRSADGVNWGKAGSATVALNQSVFIGLAVSSHMNGSLGTAKFSSVSVQANNTSSTFAWSTVADAPLARFEAQGAAASGKLYVFGGFFNAKVQATARSDAYNPANNTWTRIADMPEVLTHAAVVVDGPNIYLMGGFVGNHPGPSSNRVWVYNTQSNSWSRGPDLPEDRGAGAAARLGRNIHFIAGASRNAGSQQYRDKADHWVLNLGSSNTRADDATSWSTRANLPQARNHLGAASVNGRLYAIGGQLIGSEDDGNLSRVDMYNPATNTWTTRAALPLKLGHLASTTFSVNGKILVITGVTQGLTETAGVLEYSPGSNTWKRLESLPGTRRAPVAGWIDGQLIVSGGDNRPNGVETIYRTTWIGSPYP